MEITINWVDKTYEIKHNGTVMKSHPSEGANFTIQNLDLDSFDGTPEIKSKLSVHRIPAAGSAASEEGAQRTASSDAMTDTEPTHQLPNRNQFDRAGSLSPQEYRPFGIEIGEGKGY